MSFKYPETISEVFLVGMNFLFLSIYINWMRLEQYVYYVTEYVIFLYKPKFAFQTYVE